MASPPPCVLEVLHAFGSVLNCCQHIRMLLSGGGPGNDGNFDFSVWQQCGFFPKKALKARFKYFLVKYLRGFAAKKIAEPTYEPVKIWRVRKIVRRTIMRV